jgi:hypothetical protein
MVSQSDWLGSWPLLVPKKVKIDPKMGPQSDIFGPQNANNSTCSQSSSKRKLYYNSPDMLLYLTPNKMHCRCFGVLTSIKSCLRFYVNLETDQKALGDLKRPSKSRRRLFWTVFGPKSRSRGPQERPKISQKRKKRAPTLTES